MATVKNILFVMADQLRADYLSCYGHPRLQTPAIDALAKRGVRFTHAYVNATVCGPSRMSYYTGRSMSSHGSTWNGVPLRVGEPTLGDHLRPLGMRVALVGKTHMSADMAGLKRLGVPGQSIEGTFARECGFEPYERDDGLHPDGSVDPDLAYNLYLQASRLQRAEPVAQRRERGRWAGWRDAQRLVSAQCAISRARRRGTFRNRLHDQPRDGIHPRGRRHALAAASVLYQAALALYRAGALSRDVRRRRRARGEPQRGRAARPAAGLWRLYASRRRAKAFRAKTCAAR